MAGFYDDKENVLNDVNLGRNELKNLHLDYEGDRAQELLYELYCIPSHNEYAYYVQVYRKQDLFYLSYARTEIEDLFNGGMIHMYTFKDTKKANMHDRYKGRIVCGYKKVEASFVNYLAALFIQIPEGSNWIKKDGIWLDGNFQMIRVYSAGEMLKEIAFHNDLKLITDVDVREKLSMLNQFIEKEIVV